MKDWAEKASQEWVDSTPYDGKMAPTGGYFLQRYLEEQDGPAFNYPAVGESADGIGSGKENTQAGLYILPDELAKRTLPYQLGLTSTAQPAYVSPEIQQKTESQPTSQTMHYNANLNVSKMEVMDKATVQKVVDEMLVALAATYQVTPQGIPL